MWHVMLPWDVSLLRVQSDTVMTSSSSEKLSQSLGSVALPLSLTQQSFQLHQFMLLYSASSAEMFETHAPASAPAGCGVLALSSI